MFRFGSKKSVLITQSAEGGLGTFNQDPVNVPSAQEKYLDLGEGQGFWDQ